MSKNIKKEEYDSIEGILIHNYDLIDPFCWDSEKQKYVDWNLQLVMDCFFLVTPNSGEAYYVGDGSPLAISKGLAENNPLKVKQNDQNVFKGLIPTKSKGVMLNAGEEKIEIYRQKFLRKEI